MTMYIDFAVFKFTVDFGDVKTTVAECNEKCFNFKVQINFICKTNFV